MEDYLKDNIEAYLNNTLSSVEKNKFETRIVSDYNFADDVDIYTSIKNIFVDGSWHSLQISKENKEIEQLEKYLRSDNAKSISTTIRKVQKENVSTNSGYKNIFFYAASFVGIILAISIFLTLLQPSNKDLYAEFKNFDDLPSLSVRGNSNQSLIEAEALFRINKFSESNDVFEKYFSQNQNVNSVAYIYYGFSLLESNEYSKAITAFDTFAKLHELDGVKITWYKTLVYLKKGDLDSANQQLNNILTNKGNYKYQDALELQKKID